MTSGERAADIERVIIAVRANAARSYSLRELADIAYMSPCHFNRVFRSITGLPPRVFQCLLRIDAAKRMLATTEMSVTDVCLEAGYSSLGTFTRRFAEMVGLSPSRFRRLAAAEPVRCDLRASRPPASGVVIAGEVRAPAGFSGRVFVGAFGSPIPRGLPVGCAAVDAPPYRFRIEGLAAGTYYLAAAAVEDRAVTELLDDQRVLRAAGGPVAAGDELTVLAQPLELRAAQVTDAPILMPLGVALDASNLGEDVRLLRTA